MGIIIRWIGHNVITRVYGGRKAGLSVLLGLCTVGGLFFALYPVQNVNRCAIFAAPILILLVAVLAAYVRGRPKLLSDKIVYELSERDTYTVAFCSNNGLREADEMTKSCFGRGFIPFDRIEQWRLRNEKGFVQIDNAQGVLCACFVILGLKRSFLDEFIAGKLTEHDIQSDDILPFDSMKKQKRIYVSGVVVRDSHKHIGHKLTAIMLWVILQYIERVFGLKKTRTFYALGLRPESVKLLEHFGFAVCSAKGNRRDGSDLYKIDLNKKKWEDLIARIERTGDYSKTVSFRIE